MNVKYKSKEVNIILEYEALMKINKYLDNKKKYFIITDTNVYKLYYKYLTLPKLDIFVIKPGENSKSSKIVNKIIKNMIAKGYDRDDQLIAFGGGVVGDLAGFIASIYKRGINYINIPTTLISQVDSAIGGKVGINFLGYKNQIGSFYHPSLIIIDPKLLKTLSKLNYISGMCEVLKYAILFDKDMFNKIANNDYDLLWLIKKCIEYKIKVTLSDEFDRGERQLLNFGHTIGHAIEAKYHLPHGISIGYGMYLETKNGRIKKALELIGLDFNRNFKNLYPYILKDKKKNNNRITIVRVKDIGNAYLEEGNINEYFDA